MLGHEIVHAAARHGAQQMEKGQLMQIGAAIASVAASAYGGSRARRQSSGRAPQVGAQVLHAKFGRDDELEADKYGMKYMKLTGYDLRRRSRCRSSSSASSRRARTRTETACSRAIRPRSSASRRTGRTMAELGGRGGDTVGTDQFKAALAGSKSDAPAYAKYDEALAVGTARSDIATAKRLTNEAIALEPRESRFYDLLGEHRAGEQGLPACRARALQQGAPARPGLLQADGCRAAWRTTSSATRPPRSRCS